MKLKKLFLFLISAFVILACSSPTWVKKNNGNSVMKYQYNNGYTKYQFDSICYVDELPSDLDMWHSMPLREYETKDAFNRYMYIKKLSPNNVIYMLVIDKNGNYMIAKRITLNYGE